MRSAPIQFLERYFEFSRLETNWRTEFFAGLTTFVTMAYIILVNPAILAQAGIPLPAVTAATCLSAAFGCLLMGIVARYPIALAPGMGLNAYFTYTVVMKMGVPWQTALGAVFLSGVAFLLLTAVGIRQLILRSIPKELYAAVAGGIGLFIAFIGLHNSGIITAAPATLVTLGNVRDPQTALALAGVLLIGVLQVWRVRGAILIGVLAITLAAIPFHLVHWKVSSYKFSALTLTAFRLDIHAALHVGLLEIIFVFFFVDLFDNLGTLVAVAKKAELIEPDGSIPRLNRILFADATATILGSLTGTSTVTSYVESSAGVAAGGRSGITAIVTGLLFLLALGAAPLVGIVPTAATAPALIIVGSLMLTTVTEIEWTNPLSSIPAFLTLVMIPLSASIANGLGFGVIAYACVHLLSGRFRKEDWLLYVLAVLFLVRFLYVANV
ncbi:NCS2 family permease [Silvibacterium dinghuense]|uniref:NCS2 family permease n=1 Tax=Silvibacterium dinghuense TaxID=1560006 RepID=A0A4Q1SK44_9BACT|nr:NCS2 family permease [Silvibacterium dinghuense]RXS97819.1 NCS2 family permease [Silvibacterium dinghuense]